MSKTAAVVQNRARDPCRIHVAQELYDLLVEAFFGDAEKQPTRTQVREWLSSKSAEERLRIVAEARGL